MAGADRRILVTGSTGFVGQWAMHALHDAMPDATLVGTGTTAPEGGLALDITDTAAVDRTIRDVRPTGLLHLAAISDIPTARQNPRLTWAVNVMGTLALAEAVRAHAPACRFVFASTGEVYGHAFKGRTTPVDESVPPDPANPYAASKLAAEVLLAQMAHDGLDIWRFRPFNHIGPGQSERFAIASFAAQIARIEAGLQPPEIRVGNLEAKRDFLDVRDVAAAYATALAADGLPTPAGPLNLSSGVPRSIRTMLDALLALSPARPAVTPDPERMRPSDVMEATGNAGRATDILGWALRHDLDATLTDCLAGFRHPVDDPSASSGA